MINLRWKGMEGKFVWINKKDDWEMKKKFMNVCE